MTLAETAGTLHADALVIDLHTHAPRFVPQPFRAVWRATNPRRPADTEFADLGDAGVDAIVAKAVGDPIVTRAYVGATPAEAVERQLAAIEAQAGAAGARVVQTAQEVADLAAGRQPGVVLGVEGGDALCDLGLVERWHARGVRVVVLVHLVDNALGTTCLPWQQYAGPVPVRRRTERGLTALGEVVVRRMQEIGIVVDVAHADRATLRDVTAAAVAPVVASHTGARALQDFPRYLDDDDLRAVAATGGVIGLWPYRSLRRGVRDVAALTEHALHIADVVGVEHLALGTDMNGVPGLMRGYRGERDLPRVTAALLAGGFGQQDIRGILGENALRVLRAAEAASGSGPAA